MKMKSQKETRIKMCEVSERRSFMAFN